MYLSKFQLLNYKSFRDSGLLELKPGINIIVGQNNSGKTALLETLTLDFSNEPHRSIKTLPTPDSKIDKKSTAEVTLCFTKDEFSALLDGLPPHSLGISLPIDDTWTLEQLVSLFQEWLDNPEPTELTVFLSGEDNLQPSKIQIKGLTPPVYLYSEVEAISQTRLLNKASKIAYLEKGNDGRLHLDVNNYFAEGRHYLPYTLFKHFTRRIYRLNAERSNLGSCFFGNKSELEPDASNLAEVLNILQGRGTKKVFERFNQYVSTIFPDIKEVAVKPKELSKLSNDSVLEIRVWSKEAAENDREDLSFPLSASGTGIGQVLAILYVVITSPEPRIIIIDEPQSFLHPGAAKKLVEILKEFPQHQYFIATHSPQIISAANPSTIVQLRYEDSETKASVIDSRLATQLRSLLAEIGVSLSDVFGADNILWVEGQTEERCFPLILERVAQQPLRGTQIIGVKNTSDLVGKKVQLANVMFELYDRLSSGKTLFPPAIGFVFDREGLLEREIDDIKRRSSHPIEFINRRMYENYLFHPEAIAYIFNEEDKEEQKEPITSLKVQEWLEENKHKKHYFPKGTPQEKLSDSKWVDENIDAAKLLDDLFANFSETRVKFRKPRHPTMITEWVVDKDPNHFSELAEFLRGVLDGKQKVTP